MGHLSGCPQLLNLGFLNAHAQVLGDEFGTCHDGNVLEQSLPSLSKARGFDGAHFDDAPQLVHDERGEGFT